MEKTIKWVILYEISILYKKYKIKLIYVYISIKSLVQCFCFKNYYMRIFIASTLWCSQCRFCGILESKVCLFVCFVCLFVCVHYPWAEHGDSAACLFLASAGYTMFRVIWFYNCNVWPSLHKKIIGLQFFSCFSNFLL
jgi:hypothetical protein